MSISRGNTIDLFGNEPGMKNEQSPGKKKRQEGRMCVSWQDKNKGTREPRLSRKNIRFSGKERKKGGGEG